MTLKKRLISLCMAVVLIFSLSAVCASAAQEVATKQPTVSMSFDLDNRVKHEKTVRLPDGSIAKITAEPINTGRALSGVWKITGTNGLATMEYWIELEKAGLYTKIKRTWGLAITGIMTSYEDAKINVVRQMESPVLPAIVEGYAKFTYYTLDEKWWRESFNFWQSNYYRAVLINLRICSKLNQKSKSDASK